MILRYLVAAGLVALASRKLARMHASRVIKAKLALILAAFFVTYPHWHDSTARDAHDAVCGNAPSLTAKTLAEVSPTRPRPTAAPVDAQDPARISIGLVGALQRYAPQAPAPVAATVSNFATCPGLAGLRSRSIEQ